MMIDKFSVSRTRSCSREKRDPFIAAHRTLGDKRTLAMEEWCQKKVKALLGLETGDDREAVVLGRVVRWKEDGVE